MRENKPSQRMSKAQMTAAAARRMKLKSERAMIPMVRAVAATVVTVAPPRLNSRLPISAATKL
jgi:hypothetical protein